VPTAGNLVQAGGVTASATLLRNGTVLVSGYPSDLSEEIYDPSYDTFTENKSHAISSGHGEATATLLPSNMVLLTSGNSLGSDLYDPTTGSITASGNMAFLAVGHTATLLLDGTVLLLGGNGAGGYQPKAQLFQ
jgi:hypothetical protein